MSPSTNRRHSVDGDGEHCKLGLDLLCRLAVALDAAALEYRSDEHGPLEPVAAYRTRDGVCHQVCVNHHPDVGWRVIDIVATSVGRLDGPDDLRTLAVACAEDYARECRRYHAGTREDPPIIHPEAVRIRCTCREQGEKDRGEQ